ncbi:hypothetical protein NLG97_g6611 [Lecanicillium saksenae]|uniref:Uncharacterized protein n=1 Tax=Lecanicillium saksenae TaxID=468837 RepID=A0ACC1QRG9_9HYPO|nr:hypothetical protein NLG97_g6611 [Lecanicillium saksenae]
MNHDEYQERLALVGEILRRFNLDPVSIKPIDYDEKCPFPYNNFLYKVALERGLTNETLSANKQPFTSPVALASGCSVVLRVCNPKAEGLCQANRVENEVAAAFFARQGIQAHNPKFTNLVPRIYAWEPATSAKNNLGWCIMDYKKGCSLMATLKVLIMLSGFCINSRGEVVAGDTTTVEGGPWASYEEFWRERLAARLKGADESSIIDSWQKNGTRERIDSFLRSGIKKVVGPSECLSRVLVHGDFSKSKSDAAPTSAKLTMDQP